jgi:hypothetical protein
MTMNIYIHVTDYLKEQTAQKFQRYIGYELWSDVVKALFKYKKDPFHKSEKSL